MIEASERGGGGGLHGGLIDRMDFYLFFLDLQHLNTCFCLIRGIADVVIAKVTFVMVSSCLTYTKKWYYLCFYVTWFKSYGNY